MADLVGSSEDDADSHKTREQLLDELRRLRRYARDSDVGLAPSAMAEENYVSETLRRIGALLAEDLDLDRLVQRITDEATALCRAQFGAFFYNVTNDAGESYKLFTLSGAPREAFERFGMPRNTAVFAPTFAGEGVVRSDDITKDPRYGKNAPHAGMPAGHLPVRSYLAVPVVTRTGEVLGGLFFGHSEVGAFIPRDERLLVGVATLAAAAIDNARLYARSKRAEEEQARRAREALYGAEIGAALTRERTLRDMLQRCAEATVRHLDAAFARVWTLDAAGTTLELQASAGMYTHVDGPHGRVPVGAFKIGRIALARAPHLSNDVQDDPEVGDRAWAAREGLVAFAGHPLLVEDRVVGVMALFARAPLAPDTLALLASVADLVALGIERKRAEDERARLLAREHAARAEAEALVAALERTNRELDQFVYVASHDLKAPLRGIANLSQWVEEDLADRLTDESRKHLALLRGRVQRLEGLIEGILQYSRAGRVRDRVEAVDTARLVAAIVERLGPPPGAAVAVASDMPVVHAERAPLEQVLLNLVGNALKHARRDDARVEVSARDAGTQWEFAVRDNGPGIAPEYHERIWGIFQTLEARDRVEGTGIGLSVVRKVVETRGGRAWVESSEGGGATFRFTWPKPRAGAA